MPLVLCNRVGEECISNINADFIGKSTVIDASGKRICTATPHLVCFDFCDVDIPNKKYNIICSDFNSEISFHYKNKFD